MDVEAYVTSLPVSDAEKRRTRSDLTAFGNILASHGRTFPEECDYQEYRTQKSTDKNPKTTDDRIRRIKRYFDTLQKGEAQMTIPEPERAGLVPEPETTATENTVIIPASTVPAQNSEVTAEEVTQPEHTAPETEEPSSLEAEEKKSPRMGAPRKSPEGRTKKITVYITPALEEDVKDLARIVGTTTPDYIFRLISRESRLREKDLAIIREIRQNTQ